MEPDRLSTQAVDDSLGTSQSVDVWQSFYTEFVRNEERLLASYSAAWQSLEELLDRTGELYRTLEPESVSTSSLETLERLCQEQAKLLLVDLAEGLQRRRPVFRAVSAVQEFDSEADILARRLPASLSTTNGQLLAAVSSTAGPKSTRSLQGRLRRWSKNRKVSIPLRQLVRGQLATLNQARLLIDGDMQLVLAQAAVHLLVPWQAWRQQSLSSLTWSRPATHTFAIEREWWRNKSSQLKRSAQEALDACRTMQQRSPLDLSRALISGQRTKPAVESAARDQRSAALTYWARQQRAVDSLLHLELGTVKLASEATVEIRHSLDWLTEENEGLYAELKSVIDWLRTAAENGQELAAFPAPQANLVSAEDRAADLRRRIAEKATAHLPATIELLQPQYPLPPVRSPWRQVEPVRLFLGYLDNYGLDAARTGFQESEAGHQPIVSEIERAREVVAYGLEESIREASKKEESSRVEPSPGEAASPAPDNASDRDSGTAQPAPQEISIAAEAAQNALKLLEHREQTRVDTTSAAERHLCQALAVSLLDTEIAVERSWLGVWAHITRQTTTRAVRDVATLGLFAVGDGLQIAARGFRQGYRRLLILTGWTAPPPRPRIPVENILQLRTVLELDMGTNHLPAIYNRLFRLEPVEDPRFLVGRDQEMAGLAEAKNKWQAGAAVAVMLVGSRGSGKTSLLNCAATRVFTDVPVVGGSFSGRMSSAADIQSFLLRLFDFDQEANLIAELSKGRRVIVLEEFERTFLRCIGGFAALEEFLRILDATAANNLWIVSLNQAAFRYLTASTRLAECFSMRINSASVNSEALVRAILQRHNLSGFRLHFEPPPHSRRQRFKRIRELLGLEDDRQQQFFSSLYDQSEGNFRSAFELWRDSIERVEGGVVYTRQPLNPDYRPLMRELTLQDNFILQAVMQHGSLTTEEVSRVLRLDDDLSWRRLRRMQDLDILEPEPGRPGYRVRPQASRFVRETLYSSNLLTGEKR